MSKRELLTALTGTFGVFHFATFQSRNSLQPKKEHLLCFILKHLRTETLKCVNIKFYCIAVHNISRQELFAALTGTFDVSQVIISICRGDSGGAAKEAKTIQNVQTFP